MRFPYDFHVFTICFNYAWHRLALPPGRSRLGPSCMKIIRFGHSAVLGRTPTRPHHNPRRGPGATETAEVFQSFDNNSMILFAFNNAQWPMRLASMFNDLCSEPMKHDPS